MRVFLSSTLVDLDSYRKAATHALERTGSQVGRMEVFGARPEDATRASLRDVEESDLFVGIYAHRYGYIPTSPPSKISITEQEYDKAKELEKPMFCFIIDPNHPWSLAMVEDEPGKSLLHTFKEKISKDHTPDYFTNPDDLAMKVATAVSNFINKRMRDEKIVFEGGTPTDNDLIDEPSQPGYPKSLNILVRKSIRNLSAEELSNLCHAYRLIMNIDDNRGYRYLAGIHGIPDFKGKYGDSRLFLPWNRAYVYWFERYLQDAFLGSVSIPWWDWRSESSRVEGIPRAFSDRLIEGRPNPLYNFHVVLTDEINLEPFIDLTICSKPKEYHTSRQPGSPTSLPTAEEIEAILRLTDYAEFSDQLEDINNRIQIWVGGKCGDMSYIPFASYDPIFWSHRVMIDRIFWLWQSLTRPGNSLPANLYNKVLDPFSLTVRDVLDIRRLGYEYVSQQLFIEAE
jgi:tyrosinase